MRLISVEEIFQFELLFAKICAGYQFEWQHLPPALRQWLAPIYRIAIVLLTRYLTPKHFMTPPYLFQETLGQAAMQNYKVFYYACQAIGSLMVFVNILTGFKSHELLSVLLKKRFNGDYLARRIENTRSSDGHEVRRSALEARPRYPVFGWPLTNIVVGRQSKHSTVREDANYERNNDYNDDDGEIGQSLVCLVPGSFAYVSIARWLMVVSLVAAIYSVHVHSGFQENIDLVGATIATTRADTNTTENSSGRLMAAGAGAAAATNVLVGSPDETRLSALEQTRFLSGLAANSLIALVQASLNFCQIYGQIFVALLITSSIADVLRYSVAFDELASAADCGGGSGDKQTRSPNIFKVQEPESSSANRIVRKGHTTISASISSISGSGGGAAAAAAAGSSSSVKVMHQHNEHLLTTRVLLQAREVLLVIRHAVNTEYLFVLLFDLARFGAIFCLLDESIFNLESNRKMLPLIGANFAQVIMSILLTRIGYSWLHYEVTRLIHNLDKSTVLADEDIPTKNNKRLAPKRSPQQSATHKHEPETEVGSATQPSGFRKQNRTTALRLAQEVMTIWPTDWYTPDYKSCIEQVIYVLTFVATFHQIAEASFRVDSISQPASSTI